MNHIEIKESSFERLSVSGVSAGVEAQVCLERGLTESQLEGDLPALQSVEATQNKCGKDVTALVIISIMVQTKPLKYGR